MKKPAGKKIDDWPFKLPGGEKVTFSVSLAYVDGSGSLSASSTSPFFTGVSVHDTDIVSLRIKVSALVDAFVVGEMSSGWVSGSVLETKWEADDDRGGYKFSLSVTSRPGEFRPGDPSGNRGERQFRTAFDRRTVVERGHRDDFSDFRMLRGCLSDPAVAERASSPLSGEFGVPVSRSVLEGDGSGGNEAAFLTLERFAEAFTSRMSAASQGVSGPVTPREMAEMMLAASVSDDRPDRPRTKIF